MPNFSRRKREIGRFPRGGDPFEGADDTYLILFLAGPFTLGLTWVIAALRYAASEPE